MPGISLSRPSSYCSHKENVSDLQFNLKAPQNNSICMENKPAKQMYDQRYLECSVAGGGCFDGERLGFAHRT